MVSAQLLEGPASVQERERHVNTKELSEYSLSQVSSGTRAVSYVESHPIRFLMNPYQYSSVLRSIFLVFYYMHDIYSLIFLLLFLTNHSM